MQTTENEPNSTSKVFPQKSYFFTPTLNQLWWAFPFFFAVVRGFLAPLLLLDFYWHLKLGQVIFDTHSIPRADIFSFTAAGKAFAAQSWLADLLFYLIYKLGGFALVVFSNGILLFLILLPLFYLCRKATPHIWPSILSLLLVAFCIPWNLRPQVLSSILLSFFYWILSSYRSKASAAIYALPFLMVLWVNLHGAFVMGLALIVIYILVDFIQLLSGRIRDAGEIRRLKILGLVLVLCLLATMANPELYGVYDYVLEIMSAASVQKYVTEWQPPAIATSDGFVMFYLPFFLLTFVLISSSRRPSLSELLLFAVFSAYGMVSLRNCVWFLIVSAPMLAAHLPNVDWSIIHAKLAAKGGRHPNGGIHRKSLPALNWILFVAMLFALVLQSPWVKVKLRETTLQSPETPVGAMDFIDQKGLTGNIFHPQIYGDYLIWRLWPRQRSFFDGRVHLFDESFMIDYSRIFNCSDWEKLLQKYNIRYLLLPKAKSDQNVVRLIDDARKSGRWILRYEDRLSVLFEKISDP